MKVSGLSMFSGFSQGLTRVLRLGNGLISTSGTPRYTATKNCHSIRLAKGELHTLDLDSAVQEITVRSGSFWITREGEGKDYLLKTGESLRVPAEGMTVIEALQAGEVELR
ncbi:MAG: DUF2917 domain-containing protein [Verrucomicrobiota bacterium]